MLILIDGAMQLLLCFPNEFSHRIVVDEFC